ncbi:MAG: AAA family ATPase [Myxococcaceae bacterium]|jgi:predicted ATPase|nr:AAA family ATPase [Myxococcaceae bacterium]
MGPLAFRRLRLTNWRNFRSVDVELTDRVFIVGPNAAGKSNLLDAFRFLKALVTEGGGLAAAVRDRDGMSRLRSLFARQKPYVEVEVHVLDPEGVGFEYRLRFHADTKRDGPPRVLEESVTERSANGARKVLLTRPDADDRHDTDRLKQTAIQQVFASANFRTLVDFFGATTYRHLVPQLLRDTSRQAPTTFVTGDPFGRDLIERMRSISKKHRKGRFNRIGRVLKAVVPQFRDLDLFVDERTGHAHLRTRFINWRGEDAFQDERQMSDGTLRLIGLLWTMQDQEGTLLLEEPELSLHAAIVKRLPSFIHRVQQSGRGRQVLLSTHSEHILGDPGIAAEDVLLVRPEKEGSTVVQGATVSEVKRLMTAGLTAAEAILPRTETKQMALFGAQGL